MLNKFIFSIIKCLVDFTYRFAEHGSTLLLGKNAAGKPALMGARVLLQNICHGEAKTDKLFARDMATTWTGKDDMSFWLEATIGQYKFEYKLMVEMPPRYHAYRVADEELSSNGEIIFARVGWICAKRQDLQACQASFGAAEFV